MLIRASFYHKKGAMISETRSSVIRPKCSAVQGSFTQTKHVANKTILTPEKTITTNKIAMQKRAEAVSSARQRNSTAFAV